MLTHAHPKVSAQNLQREAFIYVRQSTPRQVVDNIESTQRQDKAEIARPRSINEKRLVDASAQGDRAQDQGETRSNFRGSKRRHLEGERFSSVRHRP
jgi:hypothetical protein